VQVLEEASRRRSPDVTDEIVRDIVARIAAPQPRERTSAASSGTDASF
jgi:hypothetical protein